MAISKRIVLHFPKRIVDRPIVSHLVKDYNLDFNILKAQFTPDEEGLMVLELTGKQKDYDEGIRYLTRTGVQIHLHHARGRGSWRTPLPESHRAAAHQLWVGPRVDGAGGQPGDIHHAADESGRICKRYAV